MSATTDTDAIAALRKLVEQYRADAHLDSLSATQRDFVDGIRALRREIGPIGFNIVDELRKLRNHE